MPLRSALSQGITHWHVSASVHMLCHGQSIGQLCTRIAGHTCAHRFWRIPPIIDGLLKPGNGLMHMQAMQVQQHWNVIQSIIPARQTSNFRQCGAASAPASNFLHHPANLPRTGHLHSSPLQYPRMIWQPKAGGVTAWATGRVSWNRMECSLCLVDGLGRLILGSILVDPGLLELQQERAHVIAD